MSVCLSVCLSVRSHFSKITRPNFTKCSIQVSYGRGSVLVWQQCNTWRTSGSVDDVMFHTIMSQMQLWSLRRSELFIVTRQVAPLKVAHPSTKSVIADCFFGRFLTSVILLSVWACALAKRTKLLTYFDDDGCYNTGRAALLPPGMFTTYVHYTPRHSYIGYPSCVQLLRRRGSWDDLREILSGCQRMAKVPNAVEILPKITVGWVGCTSVTDDRQTERRQTDRRTGDSI